MKYKYNKKYEVSFTQLDSNFELGIISSLSLIQDMMTEYFETIGSDNIVLKNENNAMWVVTKAKVKFNKYPSWKDKIEGTSYTVRIKPIRVEMETRFCDNNNDILFIAKQEACPIDIETRKIRKINTIKYPTDIEIDENLIDEEFLRLDKVFNENDKIYEQKVLFSDIDHNGHTNNVCYVKYILNTLTSEFIKKHKIVDFEIHYINESKEADVLDIYKKIYENEIQFLIKSNDKDIVRARLSFLK